MHRRLFDVLLTDYVVLFAGLESLPVELQRNFNLMRDLDSRSQSMLCILS